MRNAYALLGLLFLIVLCGSYVVVKKAQAPSVPFINNSKTSMTFMLTSPSFDDNGNMPKTFTCDGEGKSPELHIAGVQDGTKSFVLLAYDPDIPSEIKASRNIAQFNHWVLYAIPADTVVIGEGESVGAQGLNSRGEIGYVPACPPTEYEPSEHRYIFELYALSGTLEFIKAPTLEEVQTAIADMTIATTSLTGRYERTKKL